MSKSRVTNVLPAGFKEALKRVYGSIPSRLRLKKVFWETYNFLQESQWWDEGRLREYQQRVLAGLLEHAYVNVPFYRKVFNSIGLLPSDIEDVEDLKALPMTSKDLLRRRIEDFLSEGCDIKRMNVVTTSGTTGKSVSLYEPHDVRYKEFAFICHQWSRVGYSPGELRVEIRGQIFTDRRYQYNPVENAVRLSPLIDSRHTAEYYLDKINSMGARFIHGYPGAISSLAFAVRKYGIKIPFRLKAVLFASENVYPWQRQLVNEVFDCRVYSHYGMAEKVCLAGECERSNTYHFVPQYGVTEIDERTGEIIATGFLNRAVPLLRYRTGDLASHPWKISCDECHRDYYPIIDRLEGRVGDVIFNKDGIPVSPVVLARPFKDLKHLQETQLVQFEPGRLLVKAVPASYAQLKDCMDELEEVVFKLKVLLGQEVVIDHEIVEGIERTGSGKFCWIISHCGDEIMRDMLGRG